MASKTKLAFEGTIKGVSITNAGKPDYSGRRPPGHVELRLIVDQPTIPNPPEIPHDFRDNQSYEYGKPPKWAPRPDQSVRGPGGKTRPTVPDKKKAKEPEAEFDQRVATATEEQAEWDKWLANRQEAYDAARAKHEKALEGHERKVQSFRERQMTYAMLPGVAAVFGDSKFSVVMTPAQQEILPGLELALRSDDEMLMLEQPAEPIDVTPIE